MEFRTELSPKDLQVRLSHDEKIMLLGSCFTEHMASSLSRFRFSVFSNSHGIIFHPIPLANSLLDLMNQKEYGANDLMQSNDLWVSLNHHGRFSSADQNQTLNEINITIGEGSAFLKEASLLIVTFGTSIGYHHGIESRVVANCHKIDSKTFTKKRTEISEIVGVWKKVISDLIAQNPKLKVLFTVSPVRHLREGFEENQKSKATLLLAIEQLQKAFPQSCLYFPSYELMMDDLRDYRFYDTDMVHPSAQAIEYIRQKFFKAVMSDETLEKCNLMESQIRKIEHRGIHENSEQKERRIADANEAIRRILLKS